MTTRALLLALLVAGCADHVRDATEMVPCLIRARALADGASRLVTYAELQRVCRGEAP